MNTDRELLEKATKAAGYPVPKPKGAYPWQGFEKDGSFYWLSGPDGSVKKTWNPLTNDADAFRLMVDLCLNVCVSKNDAFCGDYCEDAWTGYGEPAASGDMRAATRRAITLAAARIWDDKNA